MYKSIAWELGLPTERSRATAYRAIRAEITRRVCEAKQLPILVIDEAQHLTVPVLITTNKPFSEWAEVFSSAACVVTLVDRLIHRSEIVHLDGESYRLREAKEQAAKRSKARSRRTAKPRASREPRS